MVVSLHAYSVAVGRSYKERCSSPRMVTAIEEIAEIQSDSDKYRAGYDMNMQSPTRALLMTTL